MDYRISGRAAAKIVNVLLLSNHWPVRLFCNQTWVAPEVTDVYFRSHRATASQASGSRQNGGALTQRTGDRRHCWFVRGLLGSRPFDRYGGASGPLAYPVG